MTTANDDLIVHPRGRSVEEAAAELQLNPPRPVLVLIGGAENLSETVASQFERLMARSVAPVVANTNCVVLTGGTNSGVMAIAGRTIGYLDHVELVGVAPAAEVVHSRDSAASQPSKTKLDENHHKFLLTEGGGWGSESEALFALADYVSGGVKPGIVLLVDGGIIARHETRRFVASGWPILVLRNSGRMADDLAAVVAPRRTTHRYIAISGRRRRREWGFGPDVDIEVQDMPLEERDSPISSDSAELFRRRLAWRLSTEAVLKLAWARHQAFTDATQRYRAAGDLRDIAIVVLALVLATVSLIVARRGSEGPVRALFAGLPAILLFLTAARETALPSRAYSAYAQAMEATLQAIWRYKALQRRSGTVTAAGTLTVELRRIDDALVRRGNPLATIRPRARPSVLTEVQDEFAPLTVRAYVNLRMEAELRRHQRELEALHRRKAMTTAATSLLAAAAAGASAAVWDSAYVVAAALIVWVIGTYRLYNYWREQMMGAAVLIADLEAVKTSVVAAGERVVLDAVVAKTEALLARSSTLVLQLSELTVEVAQEPAPHVATPSSLE